MLDTSHLVCEEYYTYLKIVGIDMRQVMRENEAFKHLNVPGNILQRMNEISSFKLFEGLSAEDYSLLLKAAHIHKFKEGKQLLSMQEMPEYLYALFSGEAKVFCHSEDGREAIVSLLGKGDTMLENAIMFNRPAMVSCSVLTEGEFLAIPVESVKTMAKTSLVFANNLLTLLAEYNSQLIFQFEEVTLQTAVHRVGSYLLRTKIEKCEAGTEFDLVCEKSLIASYLGMTPETFSRALSKLRAEGVNVDKRHVTMDNPNALCNYHNTAYDFGCEHWQTKKCPKFLG